MPVESKAHRPCVIWFTGICGAGKTTIATLLQKRLRVLGCPAYLLDGDDIRRGLSRDLGFTDAYRVENMRRITEVAAMMVDAGLIVLVALISPFRAERRLARDRVPAGAFCEVFVDTPLHVAEMRDPKGLYARARRGELQHFTAIDSAYEAPESPDVRVDTTTTSAEAAVALVVATLHRLGLGDPL